MQIEEKLLVSPEGIKPSFAKWKVAGVFNPGAVRLPNGKIVLLARVAELPPQQAGNGVSCPVIVSSAGYKAGRDFFGRGTISRFFGNGVILKSRQCRLLALSHFRKIILDETGFAVESISEKPSFTGTAEEGQYGVEDPRITKIGREYAMTYVAVSANEGISTCLALSKDFKNWKRQGIIFREQNKDVVIFPEKINGKFVALHRPESAMAFGKPSIWISYSPDLVYWGKDKPIVHARETGWDSLRIGAGAVPLKTKDGWLEIYHGVRKEGRKKIYSAGAMLLDLKNPEKVLARSPLNQPLFEPKESYEKKGFVNNVVFPSTALPSLNGKDLLVFCGAADTAISVKKVALSDIFGHLKWI